MTTREQALEFLRERAAPLPPDQPFIIDRFQPADATGIAQCCYAVYGDHYPVDTLYLPGELTRANREGRIHSVVARTASGSVVGHGALYGSAPTFAHVLEIGQFIVRPEYRGRHVASRINDRIHGLIDELGLPACFCESVTHHVATQLMCHRHGMIETALEVDLMPGDAYQAETGNPGRVSTILSFLVRSDRPQCLHVPAAYADRIRSDATSLKLRRDVLPAADAPAPASPGIHRSDRFEQAGVARLSISRVGADSHSALLAFDRETGQENVCVRQVFVQLEVQAGVRALFDALAGNGYFYGGYLPRWCDSDAILLQRLSHPPSFAQMRLDSAQAQQLRDFVAADYRRHAG